MNTPNLDALVAKAAEEHGDDMSAILARCDLDELFIQHGPALVAVLKQFCSIETKGDWERLVMETDVLLTQIDQEATCQK